MSVQQEQSLRVTSIQSILTLAQSAAHALMFAHLRLSACLLKGYSENE
jgi:hypothetical protein